MTNKVLFQRLLGAATVLFLIACLAIALAGLQDHSSSADIIVVPGNTIQPDGTPGPRLKARLDIALQLFKQRQAPLIFVSGGTGREGFDESQSMATYLVGRGVPRQAIVLDPSGKDTGATAKNAAVYMHAHSLRTAIVATQYFHIARTRLALEKNGVVVVGTAHATYMEARDLYSTPREVVAYAALLLH